MADTYLAPTGVLLAAAETTVYTAPALTSAVVQVVFNNVSALPRTLNAFIYTGAGPGADATRLVPLNLALGIGDQYTTDLVRLPAGYKITALADTANTVNAVPTGIETT